MLQNITFHSRLYLGESISGKKLDKLKKKLVKHPFFANMYVVVPAANPTDQLDILAVKQLTQSFYRNREFCVLGIAGSHGEALLLVEQMVQDCLREQGNCSLREYFVC